MFHELLEKEVREFLKQCTGCGKCMEKCPIPESDNMLIRSLNYAAQKKSMPTPNTINFAEKCMQCGGCNTVCPANCHREKIMLWLKARISRNLPKGYKKVLKYKGNKLSFFERIGKYLELRKKNHILDNLRKHVDKKNLKEANLLFYFGDSVYSPSKAAHKLLAIADYLKTDYEVLAGYSYCNGIQHYYSGLLKKAEQMHYALYDAIMKINPTIIVTLTGEDYEAMKNLQRHWHQKFILKTATEWLMDNIDKLKMKSGKQKITFHDSCILSRKENKKNVPRELLNKLGTVTDLPQDQGLCLCCGFFRAEHSPEEMKEIQTKKLDQVKTKTLSVECINCWNNLAPIAEQKGLKITDVISLVYESIEKEIEEEIKNEVIDEGETEE